MICALGRTLASTRFGQVMDHSYADSRQN